MKSTPLAIATLAVSLIAFQSHEAQAAPPKRKPKPKPAPVVQTTEPVPAEKPVNEVEALNKTVSTVNAAPSKKADCPEPKLPGVASYSIERCDHPLSSYCDKLAADSEKNDPGTVGMKDIRGAVEKLLKETGKSGLSELARDYLKSKGIETLGIVDADIAKNFDEALLKSWFDPSDRDSYSRLEKAVMALASGYLRDCSTAKGFENTEAGLKEGVGRIKIARATFEKLLASKEPHALYGDVQNACDSATRDWENPDKRKPAPPGCEKNELRALKLAVVRDFADDARSEDLRKDLVNRVLNLKSYGNTLAYTDDYVASVEEKNRYDVGNKMSSALRDSCSDMGHSFKTTVGEHVRQLRDLVARSKPVVRELERTYLTDANYAAFETEIPGIRDEVIRIYRNQIAPRANMTAEEINQIASAAGKIKLHRTAALPDEAFADDDALPAPVLQVSQKGKLAKMIGLVTESPFNDGTLSGFTRLNAAYLPYMQIGEAKYPEQIVVLPVTLKFGPHRMRCVLAHEVGHRFGPMVAEIHGNDLMPVYSKLFACMRKTFNLQPGQEDEAMADWIAGQVCGKHIAGLSDPAAIEAELLNVSWPFCTMNDKDESLSLKDNHPETLLRLDRIFARDPNIRAALGCPGATGCTLDGPTRVGGEK